MPYFGLLVHFHALYTRIWPNDWILGGGPTATPKVHKQSEIRHISDTVQVPRMVGTGNDQPFDLPCPCAPYGALVAYGVVGGVADTVS